MTPSAFQQYEAESVARARMTAIAKHSQTKPKQPVGEAA
ncbi:hypothetical protein ACXG8O_004029 [Citrobacter youngae]